MTVDPVKSDLLDLSDTDCGLQLHQLYDTIFHRLGLESSSVGTSFSPVGVETTPELSAMLPDGGTTEPLLNADEEKISKARLGVFSLTLMSGD